MTLLTQTQLSISKAISIKQPWTFCITDLDKRVENRNWKLPKGMMGQTVALHSSGTLDTLSGRQSASHMAGFKLSQLVDHMPLGAIAGAAVIVGEVYFNGTGERRLRFLRGDDQMAPDLPNQERWFVGRYGFVLSDVAKLAKPIPTSGQLGFWNIPTDTQQKLNASEPYGKQNVAI